MAQRAAIHTALISIHDVMPETLPAVDVLLLALGQIPARAVTLLVVPGRAWQQSDIAWLHTQQGKGYSLAGHGWLHRCEKPQTLYHRMHSLLLSRNVAEQLSLPRAEIHQLMARCHRWFTDQGLRGPTLYVPPAWAMGDIDRPLLRTLPFKRYETLRGIYHADCDVFDPLPLTGYEADTSLRRLFLRGFNTFHRHRAANAGLPLRIGIHPHDLENRLAADLLRDLRGITQALNYQDYLHSRISKR